MIARRTLEQRLKFDHGLTIGQSLVLLTHKGNGRKALVEIGKRGAVRLMFEPRETDMYSSWSRLVGDTATFDKAKPGLIVWAARVPEAMAPFHGEPVAAVPLATD